MTAVMAVIFFSGGPVEPAGARLSLSFGFLMVAAYLGGDMLAWARLPRITGYILAGVIAGPSALHMVGSDTVADLKLLDNLALSFIALAAGGELDLNALSLRFRSICLGVWFQIAGVFIGVFSVVLLGRPWIGFLEGLPLREALAAAVLIGVLSVARSPSTAIAVISETRAKGPFTEAALGVTVIIDVLVIALFAAAVSASQAFARAGVPAELSFLATVSAELAGSVFLGLLLGWGISLYIRRVGVEIPVFILAVAFLASFLSEELAFFLDRFYEMRFHIEPMLICMTAGLFIRNFTRDGEQFISRLDRLSLPVYVLFFALIGASLNLVMLRRTWVLALLLAGFRAFFIWTSAWASCRLCGEPPVNSQVAGFSYIAQAGVSLGLAGLLAKAFPEWGPAAAVTVVAAISINQVIGPVTFKYALDRVGESKAARRRGRGAG
jgi:Kef-type K+ transport system membrane component KefB